MLLSPAQSGATHQLDAHRNSDGVRNVWRRYAEQRAARATDPAVNGLRKDRSDLAPARCLAISLPNS